MIETKTPPGLPPELLKELDEAEKAAGAALTEYENLMRGYILPDTIFNLLLWLMIEAVKVKRSDAVNDCLRGIAEKIEPDDAPKGCTFIYQTARKFFLTGANDADRERAVKEIESTGEYHLFHHLNKGMETPVPDVEMIESTYHQLLEARRGSVEKLPAIRAAKKTLNERRAALDAVESKVYEYIRANGLEAAYENLLEKFDAKKKMIERGLKEVRKYGEELARLEREKARLGREINAAGTAPPDAAADVKTGEESEPKPAAPGGAKKTGGAVNSKGGGNGNYKGRIF